MSFASFAGFQLQLDSALWRQTIFYYWTQSFVWISGMKIEASGKPPAPPFFLVCNHLSYTDIAALRAVAKGIFVAKGEVQNWFLAGRICRDFGTIFIDRKNRRDIPRARLVPVPDGEDARSLIQRGGVGAMDFLLEEADRYFEFEQMLFTRPEATVAA